jgi:hypothetical protein
MHLVIPDLYQENSVPTSDLLRKCAIFVTRGFFSQHRTARAYWKNILQERTGTTRAYRKSILQERTACRTANSIQQMNSSREYTAGTTDILYRYFAYYVETA